MKRHLPLKIIATLLPTLIFLQNLGWINLNKGLGLTFVIFWALFIWLLWKEHDKNKILSEVFRISEIGAFLLPVSALIMTFSLGAKVASESSNDWEKAGAAIGTTIGGFFAVAIAFIIGLFGGIVLHLLANRFEKKVKSSDNLSEAHKTKSNFFERHKIFTIFATIVALLIITNAVSSPKQNSSQKTNTATSQDTPKQAGNSNKANTKNTAGIIENNQQEKLADKVSADITKKGFIAADYMKGTYQDYITLNVKFSNKTQKDIKGVQGSFDFFDIFDNKIMSSSITYDGGILAGNSKDYNASLEYNQFIDEHKKLRDTEFENLKYKWNPKTIIYSDGTKEE